MRKSPLKDQGVDFFEAGHVYRRRSDGALYTSMTTALKAYTPPFDGPGIAARLSEKTGIPAQTYLNEWAAKSKYAAGMGTLSHNACEAVILEQEFPLEQVLAHELRDDIMQWVGWTAMQEYIEPYTEVLIADHEYQRAGQIDLLDRVHDDTFDIGDHKTNEKPLHDRFKKDTMLHCISHVPASSYEKYTLQLSGYAVMLMRQGYRVRHLYINHFRRGGQVERHYIKPRYKEAEMILKGLK